MHTMPIESTPDGPLQGLPADSSGESAPAEVEYVTFGRYLARAREAKGLSLDDLAHLTKIRRSIIEALEHNAKKELPEKVFVLGYVRSYATAVGLNVDEAVQRCAAAWDEPDAASARAEAQRNSRSLSWIWPTLAAFAGGGAIWFIIRLQ